jgi:hypothetical protein
MIVGEQNHTSIAKGILFRIRKKSAPNTVNSGKFKAANSASYPRQSPL